MTRDDAKKILGEGATEEQVTNLLNSYHVSESSKLKNLENELNNLKAENSKYSDYDSIKKQLDDINKANMTEQEKLEQQKQEIAKKLVEANIINNRAKAKEILSDETIDDALLNSLVSDNEETTLSNAKLLKQTLSTLKDSVAKQTKESLTSLNLDPTITNVGQDADVMNFDKFSKLSASEQNKFITEHPDEFEKL